MATIVDVARRANVALSTVSNVLNGTKYVSDEVREKVMRAVEELHYETDPVARNMKSARSYILGIVITNSSRVFFSPVLRAVLKTASELGYTVMTFDSNDDFEWEKKYVTMMCQNRFDGIILDSLAKNDDVKYFQWLRNLSYRKKKVHVVSLERDLSSYGIDSVVPDNYGGACSVVKHLQECGCKNILHVAGPPNSSMAAERVRGFAEMAKQHGLNADRIVFGDFSTQSGFDIVSELIHTNQLIGCDAIFASNDQMAVGALKALARESIRVPDDIRLVGFDDSFVASLVEPSLTTVHVSGLDLGESAARMLIERIENAEQEARCQWLDTELIVRVSTDRRAGAEARFTLW